LNCVFQMMNKLILIVSLFIVCNANSIRWGILGPGRIAKDFTMALLMSERNVVAVAAGSLPNTLERATRFAEYYNISKAYGSYEELARDPEVDIVYVATTNNLHYKCAKLMLEHNKHVLMEKPSTLHSAELVELVVLARSRSLFFSTDFWTRFFPAFKFVRESIESGKIGTIVSVIGDMGFVAPPSLKDRYFNKTLGGGSIMDIGVYMIQFATMAFGKDVGYTQISANSNLNDQGVDIESSYSIRTKNGVASMTTSFERISRYEIEIYGTQGKIAIQNPTSPNSVSLYVTGNSENTVDGFLEVVEFSHPVPPVPAKYAPANYPSSTGFIYVIEAVEKVVNDHQVELAEITHNEQIVIAEIVDEILAQSGVVWDSVIF